MTPPEAGGGSPFNTTDAILKAAAGLVVAEVRKTVAESAGAIADEQAKLDDTIARVEQRLMSAMRDTNTDNAQAVRAASADMRKILAENSAHLSAWIELGRAGLPLLEARDRRHKILRAASWLGAGSVMTFTASWLFRPWISGEARGSAHPMLVMLGLSALVIIGCTLLTWVLAAPLVSAQEDTGKK